MELPTVKKFLCCMKLETGGFIVGWFAIIFGLFGLIGSIVGIIAIGVNLDNFRDKMTTDEVVVSIIFYVVMTVYTLIVIVAAVQLIRGTKNRSHTQCFFYLVLMGVGVILGILDSIYQAVYVGLWAIPGGIIGALISFYFFTCIYSLYKMFKDENMRNVVSGQQAPLSVYP